MDYKSDVGLVLSHEGHEALKELLKTLGRSAEAKALRSFLASADIRRVDTKTKSAVWLWKAICCSPVRAREWQADASLSRHRTLAALPGSSQVGLSSERKSAQLYRFLNIKYDLPM